MKENRANRFNGNILHLYSVGTRFESYALGSLFDLVSYPMVTGGSFPEGKAAGT
jgi:hypothetical protein